VHTNKRDAKAGKALPKTNGDLLSTKREKPNAEKSTDPETRYYPGLRNLPNRVGKRFSVKNTASVKIGEAIGCTRRLSTRIKVRAKCRRRDKGLLINPNEQI